ncbi:MAG: glycosyltransferase family 2 protein [Sediminibacterium sp.]
MTHPKTYPLVSVILATYNGELYIREQVDSILRQTYKNIEIIFVDDCSSDKTVSILDSICHNYSHCSLIINTENMGYIRNFEKGMMMAKGEFIAPADQDDIWLPEKIEKLIEATNNETNITYCDSLLIDYKGESLSKRLSEIKQLINFNNCIMFAIGNSAAGHAMIIRRKVVFDAMPFPTMIPHDHWLGFIASLTGEVKFINEVMVHYRQHSSSVFGAVKSIDSNGKKIGVIKKRITKEEKFLQIRKRVKLMLDKCPEELTVEYRFYERLLASYVDFSIINNFRRSILFFQYNRLILSFKKRNLIRRWLFCIKMFVTLQ